MSNLYLVYQNLSPSRKRVYNNFLHAGGVAWHQELPLNQLQMSLISVYRASYHHNSELEIKNKKKH